MLRTILKGNHKYWDEYLSYIEFSYNKVVHRTTNVFPFKVVYRFSPLTLIDLLPFSTSFKFVHKEGVAKYDFIKKMHERVKRKIQQKIKGYAKYNNKGRREFIFKEGDCVWLYP